MKAMMRIPFAGLIATVFAACGGGGNSPPPPPATYTISATISGLSGSGLILRNSGVDSLTVTANGVSTFAATLTSGAAYAVTVGTQPTSPSQTCSIANGAGTVSGANVSNIAIACTTNTYVVNVTTSGLTGTGLVLQNNGGDNLSITQNGTANFAAQIASGNTYNVQVFANALSPLQQCVISNGNGTLTNAAVTATVNCGQPSLRFAYATNYYDGTISNYSVDPVSGQLRNRGYAKTGPTPADGFGDSSGKFTYILNFGRALPNLFPPVAATPSTISAFAHDDVTGDLAELPGSPYPLSPTPAVASRITSNALNGKFFYVTNVPPANNIYGYAINGTTGALTSIPNSPFAAGANPSYVWIDSAGKFAYVSNRDSSDIYIYSVNATTGELTEVPANRITTGLSTPNTFSLSVDGKFGYVVNRANSTVPGWISAYTVNKNTGALTAITGSPYAIGVNPSVERIWFHPNGKFLYVHTFGVAGSTAGAIHGFAIDPGTGALNPIAGSPYATDITGLTMTGAPPVQTQLGGGTAAMDANGKFLYVATSLSGTGFASTGSLLSFTIDNNTGVLSRTTSIASISPWLFTINVDPSGKFLYSASTQQDELRTFKIDQTTGGLTALPQGTLRSGYVPISIGAYTSSVTAPAAPVFKPKFAYVPNATDNTISAFAINATTGALTSSGSVALSSPQAVAVKPGGKFAYAISASTNTVAAYSVNQTTGALTATGSSLPTGTLPAALAIEPSGRFLYVTNTGSSDVYAYRIDATSGALTSLGSSIPATTNPTGITIDPTGRNLYLANGTFALQMFSINNATGLLSSMGYATTNNPAHIAIDPRGRYLYSSEPSSKAIEVSFINGYSGTLGPATSVSTGRKNSMLTIDPTGRFAYSADFTDNSVTGYSIDPNDGVLTPFSGAPTTVPANALFVNADYSGKFLYVVLANKTVATYAIDQSTGSLTLVASGGTTTGNSPGPITTFGDVQ